MTINIYGLMGLSAAISTRFGWLEPLPVVAKPRQTVTLMFDHPPSVDEQSPKAPSAESKSAIDAAPDGTGTIDPSLLAHDPILPLDASLRDLQDLSTAPIQPVVNARDNHLPVASGGTGLPFGSGHGNGSGTGGSGSGRFRRVPGLDSDLDLKDLEVIHEEIPDYPTLAWLANIEGDVVLRVTINEKGVPIRTEVLEGPPALRGETMRVIKLWRFGRGIFRGQKVDATFDLTFRYILRRR